MELRPTPLPASSARLAAVLDQPPAGDLFGRGFLYQRSRLPVAQGSTSSSTRCLDSASAASPISRPKPWTTTLQPSWRRAVDVVDLGRDVGERRLVGDGELRRPEDDHTSRVDGEVDGHHARTAVDDHRKTAHATLPEERHALLLRDRHQRSLRCHVAHVSGVAELPRFADRRGASAFAPRVRQSGSSSSRGRSVAGCARDRFVTERPSVARPSLSLRSVPAAGRASRFPVASESARTESPAARALLGGRASLGKRFDFVIDGGIGVRRSILAAVTFRL